MQAEEDSIWLEDPKALQDIEWTNLSNNFTTVCVVVHRFIDFKTYRIFIRQVTGKGSQREKKLLSSLDLTKVLLSLVHLLAENWVFCEDTHLHSSPSSHSPIYLCL